ncbi:MAG: hypothetical protein FWC95_07050 [Defluviitaleaceae bacterium]|nr:hypothetical protein [Defluviitaleaceae bacterium]
MKKLFAIITAATMLLASVTAFGAAAGADPFPAFDFEGRTIRMHVPDWMCAVRAGELDRPVWEAARDYVEAKFNVVLITDVLGDLGWDGSPATVAESVAAGDPLVDIWVNMTTYNSATILGAGIAYPMGRVFESWGMPAILYQGNQGDWGGRTYAFSLTAPGPMHILIFNRDLINEAGMDYDPGEMIVQGRWSYEEAFEWMMELNSRLPDDVWVMSAHINHLVRKFVFSNGMRIVDPATGLMMFMDPAYIEAMEFMRLLYVNGLIEPYEVVGGPNAAGFLTGANWNLGQNFGGGNHVIHWSGNWGHAERGQTMDWGTMIMPWGPNVALPGEVTGLNDIPANFRTHTVDLGITVVFRHVIEDWGIPAEAVLNLIYSYAQTAGEDLIRQREAEAAGEPPFRGERGTPRDFFTDNDVLIADFFADRITIAIDEFAGYFGAFFNAAAGGGDTASIFGMHGRILINNAAPMEIFAGFYPVMLYGLVYAGLVDRDILTPEQLALIDVYTVQAAAHAIVVATAAAEAAVTNALIAVWEALEAAEEFGIEFILCETCGLPLFE